MIIILEVDLFIQLVMVVNMVLSLVQSILPSLTIMIMKKRKWKNSQNISPPNEIVVKERFIVNRTNELPSRENFN